MSFTLQHPESDLFWSSGIFGRVQLSSVPNVYILEGSYIKNVNSGNYVNHVADILHEGGDPEDFVFEEDGSITSQGKAIISGSFLHLMEGVPTRWVKISEPVDDVPVSRAAALIEAALNATKCDCECENCECENCECPKK